MSVDGFDNTNYVGIIQVWCQKRGHTFPEYLFSVPGNNGPFTCECLLYNGKKFVGTGHGKKQAKQDAARAALEHLDLNIPNSNVEMVQPLGDELPQKKLPLVNKIGRSVRLALQKEDINDAFEKLCRSQVSLDEVTYGLFLQICTRRGDLEKINVLFEKMKKCGTTKLDLDQYLLALSSVAASVEPHEAQEVLCGDKAFSVLQELSDPDGAKYFRHFIGPIVREFLCEAQQQWHQVGAPPTFSLSGLKVLNKGLEKDSTLIHFSYEKLDAVQQQHIQELHQARDSVFLVMSNDSGNNFSGVVVNFESDKISVKMQKLDPNFHKVKLFEGFWEMKAPGNRYFFKLQLNTLQRFVPDTLRSPHSLR
jgi:pentatricopeptide repeat protein